MKAFVNLAIYESFYNPEKKETAHKTYKSLGSVETLMKNGLEDPITYYQLEVKRLNDERAQKSEPKISKDSPIKNLGYFILKGLLGKLKIKTICYNMLVTSELDMSETYIYITHITIFVE